MVIPDDPGWHSAALCDPKEDPMQATHYTPPIGRATGAPDRHATAAAAVAGGLHALLASWAGAGGWAVVVLPLVTAALAGCWPRLLSGTRRDLAGGVSVLWLVLAVHVAGPVPSRLSAGILAGLAAALTLAAAVIGDDSSA